MQGPSLTSSSALSVKLRNILVDGGGWEGSEFQILCVTKFMDGPSSYLTRVVKMNVRELSSGFEKYVTHPVAVRRPITLGVGCINKR